jgi:hypothetical protein
VSVHVTVSALGSDVLGAFLRFADEEPDFDPNSVTPGVIGFVVTILFMGAVLLLVTDMVRRVRRTQYRQQVQEKLAAEREAAAGTDASAPGTTEPPTE